MTSTNTPVSTSVALATYNGARFLPAQLASIAAQDQRPDEVVVGDDQSSDETEQIVAGFARDTGIPVRFLRNPQRLGSSANFAAILQRCQGEVIFFSDQDDVWATDRIRTSLAQLQAHPQVGMAFSNAALISDSGQRLSGSLWDRAFFDRRQQQQFRDHRGWEVLLRTNVVTGATMAIRRRALACALPIPAGWQHDGWLAFVIERVHGALAIDAPLVAYRVHAAQQVGMIGWSPARLLTLLRRQDAGYLRTQAENFRALATRLLELGPEHAPVAEHARAKAGFLDRRAASRERLPTGVRDLGAALFARRYSRYGLGAKQALFDVAGAVDAAFGRRRFSRMFRRWPPTPPAA